MRALEDMKYSKYKEASGKNMYFSKTAAARIQQSEGFLEAVCWQMQALAHHDNQPCTSGFWPRATSLVRSVLRATPHPKSKRALSA
jgi:hypothetical protein